jgi:hypothetical protein
MRAHVTEPKPIHQRTGSLWVCRSGPISDSDILIKGREVGRSPKHALGL